MVDTYGAHETRLSYVEETNYGETPATPAMFTMHSAYSVEPLIDPSLLKIRGFGAVDLQSIRKGLRQVGLRIDWSNPKDDPLHFLNFLVDPSKSLSIEVIYYKDTWASPSNIISLLHKGCRCNRVTVGCSVEDYIKGSAELIGQDLSVGTDKVGDSYSDKGIADNAAVLFCESYVKKDASTLDRVSDWKWTIENNLKRVPVIRTTNGHLFKYLPKRHRVLTGELTFEFESKEEFDDLINDSELSLEFGLGGSPAKKATFSFSKWDNVSTPTRIEDLIALKAPFTSRYVTLA